METQKPHLGLTWQKRPSPPGAEWSSSSCQEDRQVRGERADDALPPPASAARPRPLQTCNVDTQRSLLLSPPLPGPHSPLCSLSLSFSRPSGARRRRRKLPRPPSIPCLPDGSRGTAIAFCVVNTNPFDRGSPLASSPSSSPTFGRRQPHRRFAAVSASPSPLSPPLRSL